VQLKASNKGSSRTKKALFLVSSIALVSSSSASAQASSSLHHSVAFHNGLSFFSRLNAHAWGKKYAAGSSDSGEGNAYSSISLKTPNTKVTPSNPVTPTTNSRARTPSIPVRLLDESAAAGAAAAAATGAGSESFTLGGLLEKDRQAVTSLPPAPFQDIEMDKEILEELTRMLYQSLNERQQDVWAKLWLNDDQGGGGSSVMLSAGDGNVTVGHAGVVDWLNVLRKEERKLDPGKKGLMLCPTTEISNVRVCVNGLHAWVTCHEVLTRGLLKDGGEGRGKGGEAGEKEPMWGTNIFRRWNGQWKLMCHFSGRLAGVQGELQDLMEEKRMREMAGGGKGKRGGSGGMPNIQRIPLRPEDLGLPPGMGAEAEITWEMDDGMFEGDGEDEGFENEDGMAVDVEVVKEGGGEEGREGGREEERRLAASFEDLAGRLLEWNRADVFRKETKKALGAVRKLAREGYLTEVDKVRTRGREGLREGLREGGKEGGREGRILWRGLLPWLQLRPPPHFSSTDRPSCFLFPFCFSDETHPFRDQRGFPGGSVAGRNGLRPPGQRVRGRGGVLGAVEVDIAHVGVKEEGKRGMSGARHEGWKPSWWGGRGESGEGVLLLVLGKGTKWVPRGSRSGGGKRTSRRTEGEEEEGGGGGKMKRWSRRDGDRGIGASGDNQRGSVAL